MSKSSRKNETEGQHAPKADVRHKFKVTELTDFNRRETRTDGTEKMMPRIAVLTPVEGGKQVRAHIPGNLDGPLEVGTLVMCRPHDKHNSTDDGPPIKFRITNVVRGGSGAEDETLTQAQNAQFAERAERSGGVRAEAGAEPVGAEPANAERRRRGAGVQR